MGGCVSIDIPCDKVVSQAYSCLFGDGNYIHMMKANLKALETTMQELRDRRDDVLRRVSIEENKGLERLAQVKGWLSSCKASCEYGKKVSEMLEEVKKLLAKGDFKEVAEKKPAAKVVKKDIQTTIGLDSLVGKAWDSIMKPERRILGIYGMGGVGKTTLLDSINNKFIEEVNEFDVVIGVLVSKHLQYEDIQNKILRRLRADQELEKETEEKKASFIENILGRKKFVLLLDDLWSAVDLSRIGVPRPTQENGSKIVFTTRKKEVCRQMRADDEMKIECLSNNEAWELFQYVVGEAALKRHPDIPTLAKTISEKCHGLPLALNVIGKAMSCKEDVHEWRHAIDVLKKSSREFPGMEENILSVLKVSYDGLEDEKVKSCFLYCSLFPEDYEITKEELIEYWINEGFINGKRNEDGSNNKGHVIIGSLVRAHLLIESETAVKMHDVLREMALWIGSTSLRKEEKQCVKSVRRYTGKFFQFMSALVVLDLSITNLTSLKYLNLSYTRISSLSVGMKGLRKLISLDLEKTYLESIDGIGTSLPNLQVLKLYRSRHYIDARSIEELQLLEHLKILTGNVQDASILESIQRLERLASCVQRLRIINMSAEVLTLNTVALGGLRELEIISSKISEIKIDWQNKEKEDLLCNSSPCFKRLSSIVILDLEEIINEEKGMSISNVHPPDMTLPFPKLESLTLRGSPELKRICSNPPALSSLKKVDIEHCPNLPLESFGDTNRNRFNFVSFKYNGGQRKLL
ncbi:hypothetical protein Bca52824_033471 [Brassica carinata]|uniref:AAA+ ATPase domain-containing protein n=1 Tax=Brassica carinata TaxID=52824 RepID=A0A8X7SE00_BRACI|nr:hypothetical protein Bca52824_033471 [Brassica carinata]